MDRDSDATEIEDESLHLYFSGEDSASLLSGTPKRDIQMMSEEVLITCFLMDLHDKKRKRKFCMTCNEEFSNRINAVAMVNRTTEEMKKKWADMQSLTKKKEAERRRSMKQTGGGPAPNFMFKNWENLVLQSLSGVAIEGISGGVDTTECKSRPSPVVPAGIIIHEVPASENSELSESASTPCARMTSINNSTYKDMNFESESSLKVKKGQENRQGCKGKLLSMEEEKISKLETYRSRKIKILEEMLELQRRSTIAVESISNSMHQSGNSQPFHTHKNTWMWAGMACDLKVCGCMKSLTSSISCRITRLGNLYRPMSSLSVNIRSTVKAVNKLRSDKKYGKCAL
uniref:Myb/SANT-like DNA-binding domain-containing protein n=1 Tax=Magallana gigas TaxID=29159 RepID=K1PSF6_MAGGI